MADTTSTPVSATTAGANWSPDSWDLSGFNLGDFGPGAGTGTGTGSEHSVVSLSEDGLSSSDDLVSVGSAMDFGVGVRGGMMGQHVGVATGDGGYVLDGMDNGFAL